MKVIIHDLSDEQFSQFFGDRFDDDEIVSDKGKIRHCIGCFNCWVKTPGTCILKDGYQHMGKLLSQCDELILISRCIYGSYSPFVRNVLDRSIPYLLPYFMTVNGETHHSKRYQNQLKFTVHFYGEDITKEEIETAAALVHANGVNFCSIKNEIHFHKNLPPNKETMS